MPSQQSSFRGSRTALIFQLFILAMAVLDGPGYNGTPNPSPATHTDSAPASSTPISRIRPPLASTKWLPETRTTGCPDNPDRG